MKTENSKALKMNEQDYMRSFKDKAAKVTTQLNIRHPGEGSSALYNLNMHQDFIISKLGLIKKLKGHDLAIKTLLFKVFGINSNDENSNSVETVRPNTRAFNSHREYSDFDEESDFSQRKTNTRNDIRVLNKLCDKHTNNTHLSNRCGETKSRTHVHSRSLDATSKRQHIQSGITKFNASLLSPQDILNNIIDQCSRVDDDCNNTVENDISNNESMFELGQHLIERYNPDLLHNICEQDEKIKAQSQQNWFRPTTTSESNINSENRQLASILKNKRVKFENSTGEANEKDADSIDSKSMTSLSLSNNEESYPLNKYDTSKRKHMSNLRNFNQMNNYYKPALKTQSLEREMPLFLNDKNLNNLAHLFTTTKFKNKYQDCRSEARKFKRIKFINQQKTQTQDRLGELTTKSDAVNYLRKQPRQLFANIPANFWFKDADKFIQAKKSMYVKKKGLWDLNEPTVYQRMEADRIKRQSNKNYK